MMPGLRDLEAVLATDFDRSMTPTARGKLGMAKLSAAKLIPAYRAVLFPGDADG